MDFSSEEASFTETIKFNEINLVGKVKEYHTNIPYVFNFENPKDLS